MRRVALNYRHELTNSKANPWHPGVFILQAPAYKVSIVGRRRGAMGENLLAEIAACVPRARVELAVFAVRVDVGGVAVALNARLAGEVAVRPLLLAGRRGSGHDADDGSEDDGDGGLEFNRS